MVEAGRRGGTFGGIDPGPRGADTAAYWDARAEGFARSQDADDGVLVGCVLSRVARHADLAGARVLDVGAGAGRYGLALAETAHRVTLTDVSPAMLAAAAERAAARGLANVDLVRADWAAADLAEHGWAGAFDLVFASMVPVLRQPAALDKLAAASRGLVAVNRITRDGDDVAGHIRTVLGIADHPDPHNDPGYVSDVVRHLAARGVGCVVEEPETIVERAYSFEDLLARYAGRFGEAARRAGTSLREVLEPLRSRHGELIPVRRHTRTGLIIFPGEAA
ncbi:class I SAM-dependent methyltransferase [Corynebacterium sphenisci]|uniref:class I SAM-dependent methyltransferase n=1 Tax=Corynebacterium sphenisci TaxID=191493 RepID=UPI0026DF7030|nr:class I SAM-dependent methyltransferase [Corynebacterium sphenisci]MDO5731811.1 class I SAM-dependent methyltransferase [Corynebacterium sphenisci]